MKTYAIIFYLNEHNHNCGCTEHNHTHHRDDYDIVGTIKSLGAWANFMPDSYLVKTEASADEISKKINVYLEEKDLLFVTEVTKDNVASLTPGVVDWINS